ncbi:hypothetical protein D921_00539 [Enterococcus faecalis F01966]|nr:hypothetical protein D921_00539 [Enterococcus faecalis F01966]
MNTSDIRHCFIAKKRVDKGNFSFGCFLQFEGSVEILKKPNRSSSFFSKIVGFSAILLFVVRIGKVEDVQ